MSGIYKKISLMVLSAAILCGCDSTIDDIDDDIEQHTGELRIEIAGGAPTAPSFSSRTVSEPSRPGYCEANMLKIWTYRGVTLTTHTPTSDDMAFLSESAELPVTHYSGEDNCNKWTTDTCYCIAEGARCTAYAMPSLAYNATDKKKFNVTGGEKFTGLKLSLTGNATPEIYFGRIRFEAYNDKKANQMENAADGIFFVRNHGLKKEYKSCPVTGKLYRIVSQLNVNISDVKQNSIKKMEMYLSNIPTELPLHGNHGAYYPVSTASAHSNSGYIRVDSIEDFSDGTAHLSTFLLPSAEGRSLRIRVYFTSAITDSETGESIEYKDYEIRPSKSYFLTGDDAQVYYDGAAGNLRHGSDLYIYNGTDNMFYSYANVRVNISGDFDNMFAETTVTDIHVEVCPSFEDVHFYPIN